ncbi:MAG: hypothetical protein E4G90_12155 [Gemmatimonadales bacterium]|nr:MAG: hypothetical protein E4G90_12155 [Gemmatimonadales bacterium]
MSLEEELVQLRAKVAAMEPVVIAAAACVSMWLDVEVAQDEGRPNPWADREREGSDRVTAQIVAVEEWWSFKVTDLSCQPLG